MDDLYEGSSALKDKYIEKFKLISYENSYLGNPIFNDPFLYVSAIDHNPIIKLLATGPGIVIRSGKPGLKLYNMNNKPKIKIWWGVEESEPDDEDVAMQINTDDHNGNGIYVDVAYAGTAVDANTHEGRAIWGKAAGGYGVLGQS